MNKFISKYILLLVLSICFSNSSYAVDLYKNIFKKDMVEVSFVSSVTKLDNKTFYIGLKFTLDADWKIYWRQPGDSGMPPKVNFSESDNLDNFNIKWPFPEKEYESADLLTNVYKRNVIIPIEITVLDQNSSLELRGILDFQVCKDICIPYTAYLKLNIYPGISNYTDDYFYINKELSNVPIEYNKAGIEKVEIFKKDDNKLLVSINSLVKFPDGEFEIYAESNNEYLKINEIIKEYPSEKEIVAYLNFEKDINNIKDIYLTFVKGNLAFYSNNIIKDTRNDVKLIFMLLLALLGGFILNFMPCVLPVLTLKISRVININNEDKKQVRNNFLYSSIGIVSSFLVLAFMTIILKYIGIEVGWGTQFQHPIFVGFLIFILIIFTANLFNIFDINLPFVLSDRINKFINNKGHSNSFFEGAFATLLATPCSAPFLGTAVGFALSTDVLSIILVFIFLGLGMSIPYILVSIFPNVTNILPRPGVWFNYLRYILAIGLALTTIWLLGIFISLIGWKYSAMFIFISLSTLLFFRLKISYLRFTLISSSVISIFILVNIIPNYFNFKDYDNRSSLTWEEFDENQLNNYLNNNKTIFVDITADWCITCKVNKMLVLDSNKFKLIVKKYDLILMRGDWTLPNRDITLFMKKLDRYGIPFNAIYNASNPSGILFSELLTISDIENKLILSAY